MSHIVFPIVLYDPRFDGADWESALRSIIAAWRVPAILLLSDVSGPEFVGDSMRRGALDVLVRPLSAGSLLPALDLAHLHWQLGSTRAPQASAEPTAARNAGH